MTKESRRPALGNELVGAVLALALLVIGCGGGGGPAAPGQPGADEDGDIGAPEPGGPFRLLEVASVDSTTIQVRFSRPADDSASNPDNYRVALAAPEGIAVQSANVLAWEAPAMLVRDVALNDMRTEATLKTDWQAGMSYVLIVTGVRDIAGNELEAESARAEFSGIEPDLSDPTLIDSNGDGLPDRIQEEGWTIFVDETGDGEFVPRHVTSDPALVDTNGDGVRDLVKFRYRLDPRRADTDGDGLTDYEELYVYGSHPRTVDTAGDAKRNGVVDNRFFDGAKVERGLSPILVDSSGDGISDYVNFVERGRDARFAYIPVSAVDLVDDLRLTINFNYTVSEEETVIEQESFAESHSIDQLEETTQSRSNTETYEESLEQRFKVGFPPRASITVTQGFSYGSSISTSTSARQATRQVVSQRKEQTRAQHLGRSVTFSATGGEIAAPFVVRNQGDVAFSLSNLELSVLWFDAAARTFRPIGSLSVPVQTLTLAPGDATGRLVADLNVSATLMEQIMENPSAIIIEPAYFDLENEDGRNFAWIHQQVQERSSLITIDYGIGKGIEKYVVATNMYREYPENAHAGTPLPEILDALGIAFETAERDGRRVPVSIGGVDEDAASSSFWLPIVSTEVDVDDNTHFEDYRLKPGQSITLAYIEDKDGDGLSSFEEFLYGTSDHLTHTPGIPEDDEEPGFPHQEFTDYFKAKVGWEVDPEGKDPYDVLPDPTTLDSNGDGCSDYNNWVMGTDPFLVDTSGDGVPDCTPGGGRRADALKRLAGPRITELAMELGPYLVDGRQVWITAQIVEENYPIQEVVIVWDDLGNQTVVEVAGLPSYELEESFIYTSPGDQTAEITARDERGAERTVAITRRINPDFQEQARASRNADGSVHDLEWNGRGDLLAWASNERVRVHELGPSLSRRVVLGQTGSGVEAFLWSPNADFITYFDRRASDDAQCCLVTIDVAQNVLVPPARLVLNGLSNVLAVVVRDLAHIGDRAGAVGEALYRSSGPFGTPIINVRDFFDHRVGIVNTHQLFVDDSIVALAAPTGVPSGGVVGQRFQQMPRPEQQQWMAAATLSDDYRIRFIDLDNDRLYQQFSRANAKGLALEWSPNGSVVATTATSGDQSRLFLYEWDFDSFTVDERDFVLGSASDAKAQAVSFDPTSSLIVVGLEDGSLRIYDVGTFSLQAELHDAHDGPVTHVVWSPDGTNIATAGTDNEVRVWSVYEE